MSSNDEKQEVVDDVKIGVARAVPNDEYEQDEDHSSSSRTSQRLNLGASTEATAASQTDEEKVEVEEEEDVKIGVARVTLSIDNDDQRIDINNMRGSGPLDVVDIFSAFLERMQEGEVNVGAFRVGGNDNDDENEPTTAETLQDAGETVDGVDSSQDVESGESVARIDSPPVNEKGAFVASTRGRRGGRQRAMLPGAEYVRRRAPGLAPSSYIERARQAARVGSFHPPDESPVIIPTVTACVSVVREPAESVVLPTLKLKESRRWCNLIGTLAVGLVIGAIVAVSVVLSENGKDSTSSAASTAKFSPFTTDCSALQGEAQPNFMTQCLCTGTIYSVASDVGTRYDELVKTFIPTLFRNFHETINSCSPRNEALVWLASGDGLSTAVDARQRYILALLFISWQGPSWLASDGWLTTDDKCTWVGVSCNSNNSVNEINLPNKNLTGNLGSEVALLTSLTRLSLAQNNIDGTLPSQLVNLSSLREISLSFNLISGGIPSEYGNMTDLTSLFLSNNHLEGNLPTELGRMSGLQEFRLSNNYLNGTIPSDLGRLSSLQVIAIDNNTLEGTLPTEIGLWKQAQGINLGFNNFHRSTIPTEIGQLSNLQSISLVACRLRGTLPDELFGILGLQSIIVTTNRLGGTIPSKVGQLTMLDTLSLGENNFTGSIPNDIGNCSSLSELFVDGNSLNGTIPSDLGRLPLATLDLIGNNFIGTVPIQVCAVVTPLFCYHGLQTTLFCNCCNCPGGAFQ